MAVSTLVVQVRTTGANQLNALSGHMRRLAATTRVAANRMTNSFIQQGGAIGFLSRRFAALRSAASRVGSVFMTVMRNVVNVIGSVISAAAKMAAALGPSSLGLLTLIPLIPAATTSLISLAGAIQLIAPLAIAGGVAMVTLKMGMSGVSDALKAGLSGDTEQFNEALKKLSPSAREFVVAVVTIKKQFATLQKIVQNRMFHGVGAALGRLQQVIFPLAAKWLPLVADLFSRTAREVLELFTAAGKSGQLEGILRNVHTFLAGILATARPLMQVLLDIAEVAAPRLGMLGDSARGVAQSFADWIREAKESGKLGEFLDKAIANIKTLGQIAGDIGRIIGAMFRSGDESGQNLLQRIREVTQAIAEWANSPDGQKVIDTFVSIGEAIMKVLPHVVSFYGTMIQFWTGVKNVAVAMMSTILSAFLAWVGHMINAAAKAFGWMPGIGPKLKEAAARFNNFRDEVNAALDGIQDENVTINVGARFTGAAASIAAGMVNKKISSGIQFRAAGGPVRKGQPYVVGDAGRPELFVPSENGRIAPRVAANDRNSLGGGYAPAGAAIGAHRLPDWFVSMVNMAIRENRLRLQVQPGSNRITVA